MYELGSIYGLVSWMVQQNYILRQFQSYPASGLWNWLIKWIIHVIVSEQKIIWYSQWIPKYVLNAHVPFPLELWWPQEEEEGEIQTSNFHILRHSSQLSY